MHERICKCSPCHHCQNPTNSQPICTIGMAIMSEKVMTSCFKFAIIASAQINITAICLGHSRIHRQLPNLWCCLNGCPSTVCAPCSNQPCYRHRRSMPPRSPRQSRRNQCLASRDSSFFVWVNFTNISKTLMVSQKIKSFCITQPPPN